MSRKNKSGLLGIVLAIVVIAMVVFMFTSSLFERDDPVVVVSNDGYWNVKDPISLKISDNSGLKHIKVTLSDGEQEWVMLDEDGTSDSVEKTYKIEAPKELKRTKAQSVTLTIKAVDNSLWGFFMGNSVDEEHTLVIDHTNPIVSVVANSYKIGRGGSAIVIFKASDNYLDSLEIETSFGKKFIAQPFIKEGYYASLIAWPATEQNFRANIVAKDKAGNKTTTYIPLWLQDRNYRVSKIELSDRFLDGKIAELANVYEQTVGVDDRLEQFSIINEKVRADNEKIIHDITSKVSNDMVVDFNPNVFYPLVNGQKVADFADHRIYSYKDKKDFSNAYHMGLDLASLAQAPIIASNSGKVVYTAENGIYGVVPILDHGFGLYTLYGHCSSSLVNEGDIVRAGDVIAKTGLSGYAMGDHLHFGVLIQGIEVRPEEWMDSKWIKDNITDVIKAAKTAIGSN